jgi:type VI secretion system protein ImpJ
MLKATRIFWGEGMFLRPQHFQRQALLSEAAVAETLHSVQRHAWGLRRLEIDAGALVTGQVRADVLEVVLHDGVRFEAPAREPLPLSRDLNELSQAGTETLLYACLPHLSAYGGNSVGAGAQPARPARYCGVHKSVGDLYTEALNVDVTALELDVRLMIDAENRDGYDSVSVRAWSGTRAGSGGWTRNTCRQW